MPGSQRQRQDRWSQTLNGLLVLGFAATILATVAHLVQMIAIGVNGRPPVALIEASGRAGQSLAVPPGWQATSSTSTIAPDSGNLELAVGYGAITVPPMLFIVVVLSMLIRLLSRQFAFADSVLFERQTVMGLRRIGVTALIGGGAFVAYGFLALYLANVLLLPEGIHLQPGENGLTAYGTASGMILLGVAALAIAEVVQRATQMREDLEGTV